VSVEVVGTVGIIVSSIAVIANAVVLLVLVRARRQFGSSVHTLIANQSAMDLFIAVSSIASTIARYTLGYDYNRGQFIDGAICVIFQGGVLSAVAVMAEKLGLVVITLERYFKIVYTVYRAVVVPGNFGCQMGRYVTVRNFMLFEGLTLTTFSSTASEMGLMFITMERYFKIVYTVYRAVVVPGNLGCQMGRYVTVRNFMLFEGLTLTTFSLTASEMGLMFITLERYFKIVYTVYSAVVVPGNFGCQMGRYVTVRNFMLFEGLTMTTFPLTASKMGLILITLERYFKIVHAIAHRKYYRDWMTKVGVALPWITGTCLMLFPGIGTTRIVNGQCLRMYAWPNKAMAKVSLSVHFSNISLCNFVGGLTLK